MERRARWRPSNFTPPPTPLRVSNALGADGGQAHLYLYDSIDSWGGEWGVSAAEFVEALNSIQASHLVLHLNSPGGDVWEATSMRAALAAHPATVHVHVDGLAASAASILATVAARVVMAPGSQQMIHRAASLALGNAQTMREAADLLDKVDNDIANFYLQRSGQGTVESWLAAMTAETWYSADEAVAAGLADEVASFGGPDRAESPPEQQIAAAAPDRWIVAAWRYAGRDNAPAPTDPQPVEAAAQPEAAAPEAPTPEVDAPPPAELPTAGPTLTELVCSAIREGVTL